jgi:hypothetical protein
MNTKRRWCVRLVKGDEDRGLLNEGVGKPCIYDSRAKAQEDADWLNNVVTKITKTETEYKVEVYKDEEEPKEATT